MKVMTIVAAVVLVAGCAQPPKLTREQQLAATTRVYAGVDKERVIDAARRVLTLADEEDFYFADGPDGFVATRRWTIYMVLAAAAGTDTWNFVVRDTPAGPQASLSVGRLESAISAAPTSAPGVYSTATSPTMGTPVVGNALYELFWRRMDYMLWRTDAWMTCDQLAKLRETGAVVGNDEPLCDQATIPNLTPGSIPVATPAGFSSAQGRAQPAAVASGKPALDRAPKP